MEELIRRGTPQRTAHEIVGKLVRQAMNRGVPLADLTLAELKQVDPALDESVKVVLGVENAVARFVSYGSTAPSEVDKQVKAWRARSDAQEIFSRGKAEGETTEGTK